MSQHVRMAVAMEKRGRKFLPLLGCVVLILSFVFGAAPSLWAASADYDDPYFGQKGQDGVTDPSKLIQEGSRAVFQQVQESVSPFTGNLSLVYTDLILPGNGGFDLKVQRTYNSRIWGRRDSNANADQWNVASKERSLLGLGWSFHFGRIRNPNGAGSQSPGTDNPNVELPDGSQHLFYRDPSDPSGISKVSPEQWTLKRVNPNDPNVLVMRTTDGTQYEFRQTNEYFLGLTYSGTVWGVSSIADPNGNAIQVTYDPIDHRKIVSVTDNLSRQVTFAYADLTAPGQGHQAFHGAVLVKHEGRKTHQATSVNQATGGESIGTGARIEFSLAIEYRAAVLNEAGDL